MNSHFLPAPQTMKTFSRLPVFFLTVGLCLLLLPLISLAYPPAPGVQVFGTVLGPDGNPIVDPEAQILFQSGDRLLATASFNPISVEGIERNNYSVILPVDMDPSRGTYRDEVVGDGLPFTVKVKLDDQILEPLESSVGLDNTMLEAAAKLRLDFSLGGDSDGDGLPDAWEYRMLELAGIRPETHSFFGVDFLTPEGDNDGDGISNLDEYRNGTAAVLEVPPPVFVTEVSLGIALDPSTPGPFDPGDRVVIAFGLTNHNDFAVFSNEVRTILPAGAVVLDDAWAFEFEIPAQEEFGLQGGIVFSRTIPDELAPGAALEVFSLPFVLDATRTGEVRVTASVFPTIPESFTWNGYAADEILFDNLQSARPLILPVLVDFNPCASARVEDTPECELRNPFVALIRLQFGDIVIDENGVHTITFEYLLINGGGAELDLFLTDDLFSQLPGTPVAMAVDGTFLANPDWKGSPLTNILAPGQTLPGGGEGFIRTVYSFVPDAAGPIVSAAKVRASTRLATIEETLVGTFDVVLASLGNLVWLDENNDGIAQVDEAGLHGVDLELLSGGEVIQRTTTDRGAYAFGNLLPGRYVVHLPASNFGPGGALESMRSSTPGETDPNAGVDDNDNGLETNTPEIDGVSSAPVGLLPGGADGSSADNPTLDFGFWRLPEVSGLAWMDLNNDQIPNEQLLQFSIEEALVSLYTIDPVDGAETSVVTTRTRNDGHYEFTNLEPGTYRVGIDSGSVPLTYDIPTTPTDYTVTLAANEMAENLNFGFTATPTAIGLAGFEAHVIGDDVRISWSTAWEEDALGFNLYRLDADDTRTQVNESLVLAGSSSYTVLDAGVPGGRYILEEIDTSLEAHVQDPAAFARVDAPPVGDPTLFLHAKEGTLTFVSSEEYASYLVTGLPAGSRLVDWTDPEHPRQLMGAELGSADEDRAVYFSVPPGRAIQSETPE